MINLLGVKKYISFEAISDIANSTSDSSGSDGHWGGLYNDVLSVGGSLYGIVARVSLFLACTAVVWLGILWIARSDYVPERVKIKSHAMQVFIAIILSAMVVGICNVVVSMGFDY